MYGAQGHFTLIKFVAIRVEIPPSQAAYWYSNLENLKAVIIKS